MAIKTGVHGGMAVPGPQVTRVGIGGLVNRLGLKGTWCNREHVFTQKVQVRLLPFLLWLASPWHRPRHAEDVDCRIPKTVTDLFPEFVKAE